MNTDKKTSQNKIPYKLIRTVFLNRTGHKLLIVSLAISAGLAGLLTPYYQRHFLESRLVSDLLIAALLMLISLMSYQLTIYFSQKETVLAQHHLASMLYKHILHLSSFSKITKTTGELVSQYTTDIPSATMWLEQTLPYFLTTTLPLIFTPIFLKITYGVNIWYSVFCISVLVIFNMLMARRQSVYFYHFKKLAAERMTLVNEWIQNIKSLRTLGWITAFEKNIQLKRVSETDNRVAMVTNGQTMNSFSSSITFWLNLLIIIYFMSSSIENLKKEDILVLIWVVGVFLSRPLRQLPWLLTMFFDALTSVKRMNLILSIKNKEPIYPQEKASNQNEVLNIQNLNLDLHAGQKKMHLLHKINLTIKSGEIVALIGPVGSGKSLLLKSIIKETPFTADHFTAEPTVYLPQDPFIFSSQIHNNLTFTYDDTYDEAKCMEALRLAHFDETHKTGAKLLETMIGERGVNLSGGQKQRLHLARLFYNPKPLFLLDDPFSAVDINTEAAIIGSIKKMQERKHAFLITTQRHTFLKYADRILYLDKGSIVFDGSYLQFLEASTHLNVEEVADVD
jgi:ABC-type multidrug transport system fused ATPase/permease subunit